MAPASGIDHFHNAIVGGYVDHVLNVMRCADKLYNQWKDMGAYIDNYSYEKDGQKKYGNRILAFSVWWDFSNDDKKGFDTPFVIPPKKSQESSFSADDIPF